MSRDQAAHSASKRHAIVFWSSNHRFSVLVVMAVAAASPALADVLRWTGEGQGDEVAADAFVLRYDTSGALIVRERPGKRSGTGVSDERRTDVAALAAPSAGQVARLATVLPALRLTTARYADHAALDLVALTPRDWALLFQSLVRVESAFNPDAVSPKGARGLAQLMPGTAMTLGVAVDDPLENLDGGARYLLAQIETFGAIDLALAAYNAGPEAVREYDGIPPYAETRAYVTRVLAEFERLRAVSEEGTSL